jgi:hypothetical protein
MKFKVPGLVVLAGIVLLTVPTKADSIRAAGSLRSLDALIAIEDNGNFAALRNELRIDSPLTEGFRDFRITDFDSGNPGAPPADPDDTDTPEPSALLLLGTGLLGLIGLSRRKSAPVIGQLS